MHIHVCHVQGPEKQMCPGEMVWENDFRVVSWLRTHCNSLIPKENGTKNNHEISKRTTLMERRERTVALLLNIEKEKIASTNSMRGLG